LASAAYALSPSAAMISAATIAALEERKLEYILGVRERSRAEVRRTVIDDPSPFVPRASGEFTELEAKQVKIGERRYIVCRNLAEARRDAEQCSAILEGLRAKLAQGDKALVGNSGFRRYLKTLSAEHFAIDEDRFTDDARFGTNSKITLLQLILRYRDLWRVEQLLRRPRPCSPPGRSIIVATWPSAAMCSAPSSPCCSPKNSKIGFAATRSPPNGTTSCAISTGCRKSPSNRTASTSSCALQPSASPANCSRRSASPCHPTFRNSRTRSPLPDPTQATGPQVWC
jgi:hypothetical protein